MKELYRLKLASVPIKIAVGSFFFGTILFAMYVFQIESFYLVYTSFFFIIIALLVNLISLIYLIRKCIIFPETQVKTLEEIGIVLANIPIVILYFSILFL